MVSEGDHLAQSFIYGSRGLGDDASIRLQYGLDASIERLHGGDRLLLCSDGFSGAVNSQEMLEILAQHPNSQEAANACVERAINDGSTDNITVIVISVAKNATFDEAPDTLLLEEEWEEESTVLF
jgi:protein phosphatase